MISSPSWASNFGRASFIIRCVLLPIDDNGHAGINGTFSLNKSCTGFNQFALQFGLLLIEVADDFVDVDGRRDLSADSG